MKVVRILLDKGVEIDAMSMVIIAASKHFNIIVQFVNALVTLHSTYLQGQANILANCNPGTRWVAILAMILREIVWRRVNNFVVFLHAGSARMIAIQL